MMELRLSERDKVQLVDSDFGSRFNFLDICGEFEVNTVSAMMMAPGEGVVRNVVIIKLDKENITVKMFNFASEEYLKGYVWGEWEDAETIFDSREVKKEEKGWKRQRK